THPAPERTTFTGRYLRVTDLPFNPAPYQQPHPPIWVGGDSAATQHLALEVGDGWVALRGATRDGLQQLRSSPAWPRRPFSIVRNATIFVGDSRQAALERAELTYAGGGGGPAASLEAFLQTAIVGTPQDCVAQLEDMHSWGVNYVRLAFHSVELQTEFATRVLPLVTRR
ncbi:MAG TPA: LLM class flavin-dependent oxidoreductase, partial [Chloroflexota bacterium]